jgi:hypothetical protein
MANGDPHLSYPHRLSSFRTSSTRTTLAFDWGWAWQARILPAAPRRARRQLVAETAGLFMKAIERWVELAKAGEMRSSIPAKGHVPDGNSAI